MRFLIKKLVFLLLLLPLVSTALAANLDRIIAIVNNKPVMESQLDAQIAIAKQSVPPGTPMPPNFRAKMLQNLIDTQLQVQLAQRQGLKVSNSDLDQAISDIAAKNHLSLAELQQKITQQGFTYTSYRDEIRNEMLIARLQQAAITPHVIVTDQDIKDFLQLHHNTLPSEAPTLYKVYDVLIPFPDNPTPDQIANVQKTAKTLLNDAKSGDSLQQLAENKALTGNDFGWQPLQGLPDLFEPVIAKMQKGQIQGPIRAPNGFHILQLVDTQGGSSPMNTITETHVQHILLRNNPLATDDQLKQRLMIIRTQILDRHDFATLAKENSQDPGSVGKGGDLGWTMPGTLDPTFQAQMDKLQLGQISLPFKTQFGWHIVQVLERKTIPSQDALKQAARAMVYEQKYQQQLQSWLMQLRTEAYVKVF